jgi:hypothetical protein
MNYPGFIDAEMRELLDTMQKAVVPRSKRKACVRTSWHTPYYMKGRYTSY